MKQIEELIAAFYRVKPDTNSEEYEKTNIISSLAEYLSDERVLVFFERIIADPSEYDLARVESLKIVKLLDPEQTPRSIRLAEAAAGALINDLDELVRQYAAMSLGAYSKSGVVRDALSRAVKTDEDINVRHNALAAIKEGGYSEWAVGVVSELLGDPELGASAARILAEWGAA